MLGLSKVSPVSPVSHGPCMQSITFCNGAALHRPRRHPTLLAIWHLWVPMCARLTSLRGAAFSHLYLQAFVDYGRHLLIADWQHATGLVSATGWTGCATRKAFSTACRIGTPPHLPGMKSTLKHCDTPHGGVDLNRDHDFAALGCGRWSFILWSEVPLKPFCDLAWAHTCADMLFVREFRPLSRHSFSSHLFHLAQWKDYMMVETRLWAFCCGFWVVFVVLVIFSTIRLFFPPFNDDLGTMPTRRPYSWKKNNIGGMGDLLPKLEVVLGVWAGHRFSCKWIKRTIAQVRTTSAGGRCRTPEVEAEEAAEEEDTVAEPTCAFAQRFGGLSSVTLG